MISLAFFLSFLSYAEESPVRLYKKEKSDLVNPYRSDHLDSTNVIAVEVGDGAGEGEEILFQTLTYLPHSEDVYSIFLGFFGIRFDIFNREVHQSRYYSAGYPSNGEMSVLPVDTMTIDTITYFDFSVETGYMYTIFSGSADTIKIRQKKYIRKDFDDAFFILEYTIYNDSPNPLLLNNGRIIFFADIDVGDMYSDNLTGIAGAAEDSSFIYQYSENDDYAGFSLIYPDSVSEYGNYRQWVVDGVDSRIDSMVAHSFPSDSDSVYVLYDTLYESYPGDLSVFAVNKIGTLIPGMQRTIAYAFAIGETYQALASEIGIAKAEYLNNIFPNRIEPVVGNTPTSFHLSDPYPNPFNSQTVFNLIVDKTGLGEVAVYDILGRRADSIFKGIFEPGTYYYKWAPQRGSASGLYYISVDFGGAKAANKVIYIK